MFGLNKYIDKLHKMKWHFNIEMKTDIEEILFVEFIEQDDHFKLQNIVFTFVDILYGLEQMDFEILKEGEDVSIKILKI